MRGSWLVVALLFACGPGKKADSDGGSTSDGGSSSEAGTAAPTGGPDLPEPRCGDGVVDAGEACDDGNEGCDACTDACALPVDPELEWSVPLAPIAVVRGFDMTQQQRAWVVGETGEGAIVLQRIEASGQAASIDLTALADFRSVVAFHVNGVTGEVGVLGWLPDNTLKLVRAGGDGPIGEPLAIAKEDASQEMAITSVGVTFAREEEAITLSWTGEPLASFPVDGPVGFIDAVGDRLAVGELFVTLVDPDGANRVETTCRGQSLATSGAHALIGDGGGYSSDLITAEVSMESCELATGERVSEVVATGAWGYHVGPFTEVVDAAPNGNPLGMWSVCPSLYSVMGCDVPRTEGFGGPGEPEAIGLDGCDEPRLARLGSDRGVYMIRRDRETLAPSLVRRGTLPVAPPWG
jgi:hypothetical protein